MKVTERRADHQQADQAAHDHAALDDVLLDGGAHRIHPLWMERPNIRTPAMLIGVQTARKMAAPSRKAAVAFISGEQAARIVRNSVMPTLLLDGIRSLMIAVY